MFLMRSGMLRGVMWGCQKKTPKNNVRPLHLAVYYGNVGVVDALRCW